MFCQAKLLFFFQWSLVGVKRDKWIYYSLSSPSESLQTVPLSTFIAQSFADDISSITFPQHLQTFILIALTVAKKTKYSTGKTELPSYNPTSHNPNSPFKSSRPSQMLTSRRGQQRQMLLRFHYQLCVWDAA